MSKDFTIPKQVNKFGSLNDFNGTIVLPFTRIIKQNTSSKFNFKKIVDLDYDDIKNQKGFMVNNLIYLMIITHQLIIMVKIMQR